MPYEHPPNVPRFCDNVTNLEYKKGRNKTYPRYIFPFQGYGYGYPGYGYPGYGYPGYPGYPGGYPGYPSYNYPGYPGYSGYPTENVPPQPQYPPAPSPTYSQPAVVGVGANDLDAMPANINDGIANKGVQSLQ